MKKQTKDFRCNHCGHEFWYSTRASFYRLVTCPRCGTEDMGTGEYIKPLNPESINGMKEWAESWKRSELEEEIREKITPKYAFLRDLW